MCKFKSAIILKDSVFIPDYDSHSDMLQELGIKDTEENACRLFVRAELIPKNDDCKSDVSTWEYIVDQDILPDWYEAGYDEKRMRDAVQDWAKNRIHIGIDDLVISSGKGHIILDCKVKKICGDAQIRSIQGNSGVDCISGSAHVECICDSAHIFTHSNVGWENKKDVVIKDNALLICRKENTIYHSGVWKVVGSK